MNLLGSFRLVNDSRVDISPGFKLNTPHICSVYDFQYALPVKTPGISFFKVITVSGQRRKSVLAALRS